MPEAPITSNFLYDQVLTATAYWQKILQKLETISTYDVTRKYLTLGSEDATTGWYSKNYANVDIKMVIIPKSSSQLALQLGTYVRTDALGITQNCISEGDQIVWQGDYYELKAIRSFFVGKKLDHRECDLTLLQFQDLIGATYTSSSVEDARYRTKVYLEKYLNSSYLPDFIVCYGMPDYSILRVFKDKGVDLVFSIGEPETTPLKSADQTTYGYMERVPITICCVDKANVSGTKLEWQAETELRRVLETYPLGSLRTLERRRDNDQRLGSTTLYQTEFIISYRRDTT